MGQGRKKKQRFKEDHPFCCFCGGGSPTTTIDHVPNRASFPKREGPEGYEFPACDACQNDTRLDEIAFSCMVYFNNHDEAVADDVGLRRLLDGLKNNLPHLARFRHMGPNEKRRAMREMKIERPVGLPLQDIPIVEVPSEFRERVNRYLRKMVRALFYKHVGRPAKASSVPWAWWSYERAGIHEQWTEEWLKMTPIPVQGKRSNMDFGDRFRYRINYSDEHEAFAAIGQFSDGLIFYVVLVSLEMAGKLHQPAFAMGIAPPPEETV